MAAYIAFQPSDYYSTTLYTGNDSTNAITGVGFQPDFTWLKYRDGVSTQTQQTSTIGDNYLSSNNVDGLTAAPNWDSFDTDGFTISGSNSNYNANGNDYCSWNWLAGTTTGITTDGSTTITPTSYTFNQTAGFSMVNYTGNSTSGALVAHGLGATPHTIFVKNLDSATDWQVYHKNMDATAPEDYYMVWNDGAATVNNVDRWNDTAPDSVNFTLGNNSAVNGGDDYIAFCWTAKSGYSKFGTFRGNNNADGAFVYLGFRPAVVMWKDTGTAENWVLFDDKRIGFNPDNNRLLAGLTSAENTTDYCDLLSNGFKLRATGFNAVQRQVYWAFAEFPIVSSNDVPGVAR